jgi:predicted dehydrogenase
VGNIVGLRNRGDGAGTRGLSLLPALFCEGIADLEALRGEELWKISMEIVKLGIVGIGTMGAIHAQSVVDGRIPRCKLTAVCDPKVERLSQFPSAEGFVSVDDFLRSSETDAVLIATPHYSHTPIGIQALETGRHVLVEKPISAHKSDAERLIAAHRDTDQVFAAMFNQRTDPFFLKLRQLVRSGDLGPIRRVNWTITNWFRTEAYYRSSDWRATWAGEGGGVLLNQCPHNLDLFQWIFGMPAKVRAFCHFGRYHDIEVEDDVTAYLEYSSGMTAVFSASTGEAPGTNRLEVAAEQGKVVIENDLFLFTRNEVPMSDFSRTDPGRFSVPGTWEIRIPIEGHGPQHNGILGNFVSAILEGTPLVAPAHEGINSLELANAFLLSTLENQSVQLPIEGAIFEQHLQKLITASTRQQPKVSVSKDMANSFR